MSASNIIPSLEGIDEKLQRDLIKEFKSGYLKEVVQSEINAKKIAHANHHRDVKSIDGMGRLRMQIDPTFFHYCTYKYGIKCWDDKSFLKDVEKNHPEFKVKCGGTKTQVGYCSTPKYSKKYNL